MNSIFLKFLFATILIAATCFGVFAQEPVKKSDPKQSLSTAKKIPAKKNKIAEKKMDKSELSQKKQPKITPESGPASLEMKK
ncbi:MAG: hypothetical protein Q8M29_11715 [Bacteroidota bacterium]|nr:hypothetical protein [Bacteroidota bacterium]